MQALSRSGRPNRQDSSGGAYLQIAFSSCRGSYISGSSWFAYTRLRSGCPPGCPGHSPHWWARTHSTATPHSRTSSLFFLERRKEHESTSGKLWFLQQSSFQDAIIAGVCAFDLCLHCPVKRSTLTHGSQVIELVNDHEKREGERKETELILV